MGQVLGNQGSYRRNVPVPLDNWEALDKSLPRNRSSSGYKRLLVVGWLVGWLFWVLSLFLWTGWDAVSHRFHFDLFWGVIGLQSCCWVTDGPLYLGFL